MAKPTTPDEFELIARHFRPLTAGGDAFGVTAFDLTDDAGLIAPPAGRDLVLTKDAMVEGVHFLAAEAPARLAARLLRVNLSDLAAMGAVPLGYLLALALPPDLPADWLAEFSRGLGRDQAEFAITLIGGDTVATPGPLTLSLTAVGHVARGRALTRRGARAGDEIYVSGTVGDGLIGLASLRDELPPLPDAARRSAVKRYRTPLPRLALGQRLIGLATAAIDLSDGLIADAGHIAAASGGGAEIAAGAVPLSAAGRALVARDAAWLGRLLAGGDDYELIFTAAPARAAALRSVAAELDLALTRIGRVTAGPGLKITAADGTPLALDRAGWRHF